MRLFVCFLLHSKMSFPPSKKYWFKCLNWELVVWHKKLAGRMQVWGFAACHFRVFFYCFLIFCLLYLEDNKLFVTVIVLNNGIYSKPKWRHMHSHAFNNTNAMVTYLCHDIQYLSCNICVIMSSYMFCQFALFSILFSYSVSNLH